MTWEGKTTEARSVVAFRLGEHEFCVDVKDMHEVVPYRTPRTVPGGPEFLEGVLEVRGIVLPVLDLRARLDYEPGSADRETRVLVTSIEGERVGLVVDAVTDVVRLPPEAISAPPEDLEGAARTHIVGLASVDERELLVLGPGGMLTEDERRALLGTEGAGDSAGGGMPSSVNDAGASAGAAAAGETDAD